MIHACVSFTTTVESPTCPVQGFDLPGQLTKKPLGDTEREYTRAVLVDGSYASVSMRVSIHLSCPQPLTSSTWHTAYCPYTGQKALNSNCRRSQLALLTYQKLAVSRVAEQMPKQCAILPNEYVDELCYNRAEVLRPWRNASKICFADDGILNLKHWKLVTEHLDSTRLPTKLLLWVKLHF